MRYAIPRLIHMLFALCPYVCRWLSSHPLALSRACCIAARIYETLIPRHATPFGVLIESKIMTIDYSRIQAKLTAAPKQARAIRKVTALSLTARANAAELKQAAARVALAESALKADTLQAERFTRLYEAFNMITRASTQLSECITVACSTAAPCTQCASAVSALVSFKRQRDAVFALPLLPADVRAGGRFYATARKLITNNSTRITHGDLLLTASGVEDIVQEGLFLAYMSSHDGDLITVNSADTGWISSNGAWVTRVPTIGGMYRATRRAYYRELALTRTAFRVTDSIDMLNDSMHIQPVTPTVDATMYAFHQRPARLKASNEPVSIGAPSPDARHAAELYAAYANALVQGDTIANLSAVVGIAPATMARKLRETRIELDPKLGIHVVRLLPGATTAPKRVRRAADVTELESSLRNLKGTLATPVVTKRIVPTVNRVIVRTNSSASLESYRAVKVGA